MQMQRAWVGAVLVGAAVLFAGCDSSSNNEVALEAQHADGGQDLTLNDAQILRVLIVANEGEVLLGQLGQDRATDVAARDFNARMVTEHTAARQRLEQLAQAQGIPLEDSVLSQKLQEEAQRVLDALSRVEGATFDLAVMDAQVALHAGTATVGDTLLTPQVDNAALAQELMAQRMTVQAHLQEAATLQNTLFNARFLPPQP